LVSPGICSGAWADRSGPSFQAFLYLSQDRLDLATAVEAECGCRAYLQARLGDPARADAEIERLLASSRNPLPIAADYAGLGQRDKALEWLEKAADSRVPQMIWIQFQASFDSLHGTARYQAVRSRMHLPVN
jgi:hypothetical protein